MKNSCINWCFFTSYFQEACFEGAHFTVLVVIVVELMHPKMCLLLSFRITDEMQSTYVSSTPFPTIRTHSFSLIKDYVDEQILNSIKNSKVS